MASSPDELAAKLAGLALKPRRLAPPTIGFLFPGQGSLKGTVPTEIAQPAIVRESLAALRALAAVGLQASVAVGHSVGEIAALAWAGALDESAAIRLAERRGRGMADVEGPRGAMAAIAASASDARRRLEGGTVVIAGLNVPGADGRLGETDAVKRGAPRASWASARRSADSLARLPLAFGRAGRRDVRGAFDRGAVPSRRTPRDLDGHGRRGRSRNGSARPARAPNRRPRSVSARVSERRSGRPLDRGRPWAHAVGLGGREWRRAGVRRGERHGSSGRIPEGAG